MAREKTLVTVCLSRRSLIPLSYTTPHLDRFISVLCSYTEKTSEELQSIEIIRHLEPKTYRLLSTSKGKTVQTNSSNTKNEYNQMRTHQNQYHFQPFYEQTETRTIEEARIGIESKKTTSKTSACEHKHRHQKKSPNQVKNHLNEP
ncbi:hypothetical protein L2E82_12064 [Cichorium intybus]|uniref:Uncharacterized protein n=1 Tax=Cichorium intybus TaxID=13427 RepID=A0ACB9GEX9_CICIN|nr:hypothetical protein L2E82_12064 [Cichorium intybus]